MLQGEKEKREGREDGKGIYKRIWIYITLYVVLGSQESSVLPISGGMFMIYYWTIFGAIVNVFVFAKYRCLYAVLMVSLTLPQKNQLPLLILL